MVEISRDFSESQFHKKILAKCAVYQIVNPGRLLRDLPFVMSRPGGPSATRPTARELTPLLMAADTWSSLARPGGALATLGALEITRQRHGNNTCQLAARCSVFKVMVNVSFVKVIRFWFVTDKLPIELLAMGIVSLIDGEALNGLACCLHILLCEYGG